MSFVPPDLFRGPPGGWPPATGGCRNKSGMTVMAFVAPK